MSPVSMAVQTPGKTTAGEKRPAVLLVEDDPALRAIVQRSLEARQYHVHAVPTVADALAVLSQELPAVIILEISLPDGSGWDVLRRLRAQGRRVPVIVVSAVRCSPARLEEFRPDAYFPKPFPLSALLAAVERLTGSRVEIRAAAEQPGLGMQDWGEASGSSGLPPAQHPPDTDEPATYRVLRVRRSQPPVESARRAGFRAATVGQAAARHETAQAMERALCELVADPQSGITGAMVVSAKPASIARLEALAADRGLVTVSACSPSLQRGWIRLTRRERATGIRRGTGSSACADAADGSTQEGRKDDDRGHPLRRAEHGVLGTLARLRNCLR